MGSGNTQQVPNNEWEAHRETITELYLKPDMTLTKLVASMGERGFTVTYDTIPQTVIQTDCYFSSAQLETRLSVWGIRKNLNVKEWAYVLNKIDSLDPSVSYKVSISGVELSEDRVDRARRHVRKHQQREQTEPSGTCRRSRKTKGPHRTRPQSRAVPEGVLIEVLDSNGNWISIGETDNLRTEAASPRFESIGVSIINDEDPPDSVHGQSTSGTIMQTAFADLDELYTRPVPDQHALTRGSPSRQIYFQARGYSPYRNSFELGHKAIGTATNEFPVECANTQSTLIRRLCSPDRLTQCTLVAVNSATPYTPSNLYNHLQHGDDPIWQGPSTTLDADCNFSLHMSDTEWSSQHQFQSPSYIFSSLGESPSGPASIRLAGHESMVKILPFTEFEQHLQLVGASFGNSGLAIQGSFLNTIALGFFIETRNIDQESFFRRNLSLDRLFQNLDTFLPNNGAAVITHSQASETRFIRALLFSLLNGFVGLNDISTTEILRLFGRLRIFSSSFLMLLRDGPRHASRTFLDNIFRACIEVRDTKLVREMLELRLVDVNNIAIKYQIYSYTPIARAVALCDLDLIKLLIDYGADMNKASLEFDAGVRSTLHINPRPQMTHASLAAMARVLIKGGASMSPHYFHKAWSGPDVGGSEITGPYCQPLWEVACQEALSLSMCSSPSHHEVFFGHGDAERFHLAEIARHCSEEYSIQLIHDMIELCQKDGCGTCLSKTSSAADDTAAVAMSQGKTKLVQFLLPYVKDSTVIFVAAIVSKEAHLIELALAFQPNLAPPTAILYPTEQRQYSYMPFKQWHHPTWPLIEAVRTGNKSLIRRLQAAGALYRLETGLGFRDLIDQAACWGDLSYVQMLLSRVDTSFFDIRANSNKAIILALEHDNIEVAWLLLDYCSLPEAFPRGDAWRYHLRHALKLRNAPLLHAILKVCLARAENDERERRKAFEWGDVWAIGDVSLIRDILISDLDRELYHEDFDEELCHENMVSFCRFCIAEDNPQLFQDILASLPYPGENLMGKCLAISVEKSHSTLISYLLDQGASPFNPSVLVSILRFRPEMLQALIDEFALRRKVPKRIGTYQLSSIMGENLENIEALDALLQIGAIDMIRLDRIEASEDCRLTPLGLVITSSLIGRDGYLSIVEKMLNAGSDPNAIASTEGYSHSNLTGFMLGIETGYEEVVELLIKHKAKVNPDLWHAVTRTPLQYAVELGNLRMVHLLLRHNAIINAKPAITSGGTALQFAAITGNCTIAKVLLGNGAELGALPSKFHGRWPLEGAAEHGRLDMIQLLWNESIERKTPLGFQRRQCLRAMELARHNGHAGCMNLIEELSGIPVNRLDVEDYGAMLIAYNDFDKEGLERIWCIGDGWANPEVTTSESKSRRQLWYENFKRDNGK